MNSQELIAIAERVEKAEGPDRELDAAIMDALVSAGLMAFKVGLAHFRVTASLDAAMTLVPEGMEFSVSSCRPGIIAFVRGPYAAVGRFDDTEAAGKACAATPALALTAASLRAIAEEKKNA